MIAFFILSCGILTSFALSIAVRSLGLPAGSPPPSFAATGYLLDNLGKNLASFCVGMGFLVFDLRPFGMSSHEKPPGTLS